MVETAELYNMGVRSGAIDGDAVMVGVPYGWRLIAAPTDGSSHSLIFWEPVGNDDCTPSFDKVVRDFCHCLALANRIEDWGLHTCC
jgi:hypothetical protein